MRPRRLLLSAAALVLLAGACTDDDPAGTGAAGPEEGAAAVADEVPAVGDQQEAEDEVADVDALEGDDEGPFGGGEGLAAGATTLDDIPDLVDQVAGSVFAVQVGQGQGSGVIYDEGVGVTNAHVVMGAETVQVVLATGEVVTAEVVGTDPFTDLAVLDLPDTGLDPLPFAEVLPPVGTLAIAIGNPLGFENTVSQGVVSGLERSIPGGGPSLVGLLQTDAAISPGNSGGALIGPDGEVIGINVAYIPPTTPAVALGFAIPAPVVIEVVERILAGEPVDFPYIGIRPYPITAQAAQELGLDPPTGVLVGEVVPGGPAAAAGFQTGDVIQGLGGQAIADVGEFLRALRDFSPGETVTATVIRDGQLVEVPIELAPRPETAQP